MTKKKIQWHPGFYAAMRLDFKKYDGLHFEEEYQLTKKPLEVDLLIIKKLVNTIIDNSLGRRFSKYNIFEYKSPGDHNFDVFALYQGVCYASYYCASEKTRDVTLFLVTSKNNFNLIKWLRKNLKEIEIDNAAPGVYDVKGSPLFKMCIVITEELDPKEYEWITKLRKNLSREQVEQNIENAEKEYATDNRSLAEAVMQVSVEANRNIYDKIKEESEMCEALYDLMRPEIEANIAKAQEKGREEGKLAGQEIILERVRELQAQGLLTMTEEAAEMLKG